jgi:uncharacterized protein YjbI with pentapeptide repeats
MGLDRRLTARWRTPEGEELAAEVASRLLAGRPLDGLALDEHEGRLDLRGLTVAPAGAEPLTVRSARFQRLDLSGARLEQLRLFGCGIDDCRFEAASCREWRLWACDVTASSFAGANLRSSMLGGWDGGRGNVFRGVSFTRADLRGLVCPTATFIDCDLSDATLVKVDFQSSGFIRCRFAGELREVIFWDHGFQTGKPDPNPMEDVDFSEAELPFVEFRRLDLDLVRLPRDDRHVVVEHYRCVLRRAAAALAGDDTVAGRRLAAGIAHRLKWAGPRQRVGVFHRESLGRTDEEVAAAAALLRRCEMECGA